MSILVDKTTRIICQGFTSEQATFHCEQALACGTNIVGGVTVGHGGQTHLGRPVFDTVAEAVAETRPDASLIFMPPASAADAIMEAAEAGIGLIVCVTENIPLRDIVHVRRALQGSGIRLVGPNTPGIITPGEAKMGLLPASLFKPGSIGIISRSSTLLLEAAMQITSLGLGQSTCVGIGGDRVIGIDYVDCLRLFLSDPQTEGILLIGEIGGALEEKAAAFLAENAIAKPVVAYIAGLHAPAGRRLGHAGARIAAGHGDAASKIDALRDAGVIIAETPDTISLTMQRALHLPARN
ncbi:MAG TPA: succinate--CoA ligase subunit alpha [Rhodospirillaceae bacterium]|nr:MAG: succinate--CoA ligase subunit alpha [Alphaproteobacteria bacterium GWF2_58_20]HAU29909.1 succinate--CoA ligase subunit alpha [Rhodospirillaceae bacterium]